MQKYWIWVAVIFVLTFGLRLFLAFQTQFFDIDEGYFAIRQLEHIQDTGKPLFQDELSYSGRSFKFLPAYYMILGFLSAQFPLTLFGKILPNFFASFATLAMALVATRLTSRPWIIIFSSLCAGTVPIFRSLTINSLNATTLIVPFFLLLLYFFLSLNQRFFVFLYLVTLVLSLFLSPLFLLFVLGLLFYLALSFVEHLTIERAEVELILFSLFFTLLGTFWLFRDVLVYHGATVLWQNIPTRILSNTFCSVSVLDAVTSIGLIPFILGIFGVYRYAFREKRKDSYLLIGLAASLTILLWLRLLPFTTALLFLSFILIALSAKTLDLFDAYLDRTRFSHHRHLFIAGFFLAAVLTLIIPGAILSPQNNVLTDPEYRALQFISEKSGLTDVVLASPVEGNLITALAHRLNVLDDQFLFIKHANERYDDVETIFQTRYQIEAIRLLNKYYVDYIYFSPRTKQRYGINELPFTQSKCFLKVYDDVVQIWKSECFIRGVRP